VKYLLVADTHLGIYGDSDAWHIVALNIFKDIIDTCHRENIDTIIHLGDFFHNRKSINTKTQAVAHGIAAMLDNFHTFMIVGNHDSYYRNTITPNSLQFLNQYKHITVVDIPTEIDPDIIAVPWGWHDIKSNHKYCMGHFQISGFHMNDNYICKDGDDIRNFSEFEQVYSGHFHTPSQKGNITYLGAPYQQTFNDKGGMRGYYIWEDGQLDFFPNITSPKFEVMNTNKLRLDEVKGNIVKLIFDKDYGSLENQKIIDSVMKKEPMKLVSNFSEISMVDNEEEMDDEIKLLDHDDIIKEYVDKKCKLPENMNKNMLLNIIMKLTGEIRNDN